MAEVSAALLKRNERSQKRKRVCSGERCPSCGAAMGLFKSSRVRCGYRGDGCCGRVLCSGCTNFAVGMEREDGKCVPVAVCELCLPRASSLDFGKTAQVYEARSNKPTLVFVHGAGGTRLMFDTHCEALRQRGFRCVAIDLPGHGARYEEDLTVASAVECVVSETAAHVPPGQRAVVVGASLGGYVAIEALGARPDVFAKAVVADAGQAVGTDAGCQARAGLSVMSLMMRKLSTKTLMDLVLKATAANAHMNRDALVKDSLRPGMFFHSGEQQIQLLRDSNPVEALPEYHGPILFINGSKDHHDSDARWLAACPNANCELEIIEGADHFFTHDDRFMHHFIDRIDQFASA